MRYIFVLAVCLGFLGGCATIPEEQCAKVDWYEQLRDQKNSDSKRNQLRSEIRELDRRRESLRDDLFTAERELERIPKGPAAAW
jgi:hypothetical protein